MASTHATRSQKWRYGIVLDAGSSGTRLHVYRWLDNAASRSQASPKELQSLPAIESKGTEKIHPGVSTFGDKPDRVGPDHLGKLFKKARKIIPKDEEDRTPLFLLATAGMRLLDDEPRERLLEHICSYAQSHTKFLLPDCRVHIRVIPGEVEGLYGWIAANYLLGGFDSPLNSIKANDHPTYGFLDMGGASAQIAFAPNATMSEKHANDLQLMRFRTVDGTTVEYKVFTTTWLGFGVNQARQHYVEKLQSPSQAKDSNILEDPCLPTGLTTSTKGDVFLPGSKEVNGKTPYLKGTGNFKKCLDLTYPLLEKDTVCDDDPCLIGGTHVPPIDFNVNHFVGVSEYWHTTHEIFEVGHKDKAYDFNTYQKRVSEFCSQDWGAIEESIKIHKWGKKVDEKTAIEVCFKASWLINVLHEGIGVPRVGLEELPSSEHNGTKKLLDGAKDKGFTPTFQPINKIEDEELSWTLGKIVLYASSQIPPADDAALPVGFGSNVPGIPPDFQYPSSQVSATSNMKTSPQPGGSVKTGAWSNRISHTASARRIPGILLFLLIFCLVGFFLCGRSRRHRLSNRFSASPSRRSGLTTRSLGGKRGFFGSKAIPSIFRSSPSLGTYERVLEDGTMGDMELDQVAEDNNEDYNDVSDSSSGSGSLAGKTSGWATPRLRGANGNAPNSRGSSDALSFLGSGHGLGLGLTSNAMDRSGLTGRVDSRDRLAGMAEGRVSGRASPSRSKGLGSLIED